VFEEKKKVYRACLNCSGFDLFFVFLVRIWSNFKHKNSWSGVRTQLRANWCVYWTTFIIFLTLWFLGEMHPSNLEFDRSR